MLKVVREVKGSRLILNVKGVLDYSTINEFNENVGDVTGITTILVDFSGMDFLDSTGIGAVLDILHLGNRKGIVVEITGLNDVSKQVFETIGVFQIMEALGGRVML